MFDPHNHHHHHHHQHHHLGSLQKVSLPNILLEIQVVYCVQLLKIIAIRIYNLAG